MLFLDAAAHLPICQKAIESLIEFNQSLAGHGHPLSLSVAGQLAAGAIEEARRKIASLLGAESASQIVFTSGCSNACEWAFAIMVNKYKSSNVWISPTEHPAVKQAAVKYFGKLVTELGIDGEGQITSLEGARAPVACVYLQNELGVIQPLERLKNCIYLFSDMSQAPGKVPFNLSSMNVDLAAFGAHKFGGPAGVGFLYFKNTSDWMEFGTGSRYTMDRAGTPDTAGIVATAAALEWAIETMPARTAKMIEFRDILESGLEEMGFEIIGKGVSRTPGVTFVRVGPGKGIEYMLALGGEGISVGLGSACGCGTNSLMTRIGKSSNQHDYMRISQFGEYGKEEAEEFLTTLKGIRR